MPHRKGPPRDVDQYVAEFPPDVRRLLQGIRQVIKRTAPGAEEVISYGMPAYVLNGVGLLSFAAWKNHIALYPAPKGTDRFNRRLQAYRGAKSTVRFPMDAPIPVDLLVQIVKLRAKDSLKRAKERAKRKGK